MVDLGGLGHMFSLRALEGRPQIGIYVKNIAFDSILDEDMYRIRSTLIAVIAIIIVLFVRSQAVQLGVGGIFNIVTVVMIVLIIFGLIRTWFRG